MKHKNKNYSRQFMEEAIEKASNLIELLTNQNEDLKIENLKISEMIDVLSKNNSQAIEKNIQVSEQNENIKKQNHQITNKNLEMKEYIKSLEGSLEEKTKKNKQLHEKISEYVNKYQQINKKLEKENRKNLSLSNENEYLMKILDKQEVKENSIQNECKVTEHRMKEEVFKIQRTKQAFSRRCEEFKVQNQKLKKLILTLEQKNTELLRNQGEVQSKFTAFYELQKQLRKTNDALDYMIESTLKVKPEEKLYTKIDQIKSYLCYRLQHIENLTKPLIDLIRRVDPLHYPKQNNCDIQTMGTLANRLATYLGQLLK